MPISCSYISHVVVILLILFILEVGTKTYKFIIYDPM